VVYNKPKGEKINRGDIYMSNTNDADFCFIDPEIERRAEFLSTEITKVSQLVELQAQRETFEFGRRVGQKEKDILSQAFHLAAKKMGLI
jgi:hypothetical protein